MSEESLTDAERLFLLKTARKTIEAKLNKDQPPRPTQEEVAQTGPHLEEPRGCFVTLHKRGQLRGCIGNFVGEGPLWKNVSDMAVQAAFYDPRFSPLKESEFKDIDIEISVLSPLTPVKSVDEIKVGLHGIFITRGPNRGVLLPQVATEQGWDLNTFLEHTCMKAGLHSKAWKEPDTVIEIFSAQVFGEKESSRGCN